MTTRRLLRDPTLHFGVVWLTAPIFAIVGTSLDRPFNAFSASLAGWFLTLSLWSAFGIRSVVYQWKTLSRSSEGRWPDLSRTTGVELRILASVTLITLFSFLAALIVLGLLVFGLLNTFSVAADVQVGQVIGGGTAVSHY